MKDGVNNYSAIKDRQTVTSTETDRFDKVDSDRWIDLKYLSRDVYLSAL